jgi:hypothetical protein
MRFLFVLLVFLVSCNYNVNLKEITKMEFDRKEECKKGRCRFIDKKHIVQGEKLKNLINELKCKKTNVMWKGGIKIKIFNKDGSSSKIPGFSFYGSFIKFNRKFWCKIDEKSLKSLWNQ